MKTIEELINDNRATIDQINLPAGHRERMEARLNSSAAPAKQTTLQPKRKTMRRWIAASAVAVAAAIALALYIITPTATPPICPAAPLVAKVTKIEKIESPTADTVKIESRPAQKPQSTTQRVIKKVNRMAKIEAEAAEVEEYFTAKRDEAIEEVNRLLDEKDPEVAAQIRQDLEQLTNRFKTDDAIPKSMLVNNPDQYMALTKDRLVAQRELVGRVKYSVLHFTDANAPQEPILN